VQKFIEKSYVLRADEPRVYVYVFVCARAYVCVLTETEVSPLYAARPNNARQFQFSNPRRKCNTDSLTVNEHIPCLCLNECLGPTLH